MTTSAHVTSVRGESFAVSGDGGDLLPGGAMGFFVRDVRFLDQLELLVNGNRVVPLTGNPTTTGRAVFHGYLPPARAGRADADVLVTRTRQVDGGMAEEIVLHNAGSTSLPIMAELRIGTDFAGIFDVRHHRTRERVPATGHRSSIVLRRSSGPEQTLVTIHGDASSDRLVITPTESGATAWLQLELAARGRRVLTVEVAAQGNFGTVEPSGLSAVPERPPAPQAPPELTASDTALDQLLRRSLQDLQSLVMADPLGPDDRFAAAGSPWFLTLFGRDSVWSALMALPVDPDLALGTLRTLARRQGTRVDDETGEQPGKVLHEVRHGAMAEQGDLPPWYYGTIDATPLFVVLAHEAWRWGVPDNAVRPLLDDVEAALDWMTAYGDADGDGFLEYLPPSGRGLANQGWKDSADGIRFHDGRIARAPLALAEVQGYAFAAARGGAALLDHFDRPGGDRWRDWAQALANRFREHFWVADEVGPYPAVALDADKVAVDSLASNMGHLLFTGILAEHEARLVGQRLASPELASGFGLRTLSSDSGGYNPLSYHCGSVWPHDTAIAIWGLARSGQDAAAATLVTQLLTAAPAFDGRLPELFSGLGTADTPMPVPYPSACRPQAWAAGAGLLVARALCGLEPDVPAQRLRVHMLDGAGVTRLEMSGVRLGGRVLDVRAEDGQVEVDGADPAIRVTCD